MLSKKSFDLENRSQLRKKGMSKYLNMLSIQEDMVDII